MQSVPQPPEGEPYWKVVDSTVPYAFFGADVAGGDPNTVTVPPGGSFTSVHSDLW